jgi:hypothetical protein
LRYWTGTIYAYSVEKGESMKSQEILMALLACLFLTGCERTPKPRSSISVRSGVRAADFVGTWAGETHDKEGEGGTSDTMEMHVEEITKSRLEVFVLGSFPDEGNQKIKKVHFVDDKMGFYMQAMDGKTVVWLGFDPSEGGKLIGESFALEPTCDGRIIELTREKE